MRTCLLILGMHRSGTSALTGVLNLMGVSLGKRLLPSAPDNPKGFYENKDVTHFNEFVLLPALNSSWDDVRPLSYDTFESLKEFKPQALEIIRDNFSDVSICAIKDPRLCILFPFWESVLKEAGFKIKVILPVRHPMEVALSLKKRNGFPIEKGILLWTKHVLFSEFFSREYKRVFVKYEDLVENPCQTIEYIQSKLRVNFPESCEDRKESIQEFIDPSLKHHNTKQLPENIPDYIEKLIHVILHRKRKSVEILDKIRERYIHDFRFFESAFRDKKKKARSFYVKENVDLWFDTFVIDLVNLNLLNGKLNISGLACLKRSYKPSDFGLILKVYKDNELISTVKPQWEQPSPVYAERNPTNPNAKRARFSIWVSEAINRFEVFLNYRNNSYKLVGVELYD